MANMMDYLIWRGDIPLSVDPFNEVDNLILSWLAYSDFDGIAPADGREILLPELAGQFFRVHPREEVLAGTAPISQAPLLMDGMLSGARFRDMKLSHYINEIDTERDQQISAMTFLLDDGSAYVAFRGTDRTIVGWKEDFDFTFLTQTAGQQRAVEYLNRAGADLGGPLLVGGHSKGGNFAVYAASFCDCRVQEQIRKVYTNDGPGFRHEILESEGYQRILPRIVSIVPEESVVGMLMDCTYPHQVVASSESGIMQHDARSWQLERNHFCPAELSDSAKFVEKVMGRWLAGMSDETRSSFVDTVFSLLESTGKDNLDDIAKLKIKGAETMLASLSVLSREKQSELWYQMGQLLKTGRQEVLAQLSEAQKTAEDRLKQKIENSISEK